MDSNPWPSIKRRLGLLLLVTEEEWRTLPVLAVSQALLVAGLVYGLSGSNSLFTQRIAADALPMAFVASAVAMLLLTPPVTWVTRHLSRRASLWLIHGALAASLVAVQTRLHEDWALWAFFVVAIVAGGFTMLVFWSMAADLYHPRQARRLFPVIGAGGSVGAILAGLTAGWITGRFGTESLSSAWAACLVAVALLFELRASVLLKDGPREDGPGRRHVFADATSVFREVPVASSLAAITALMVLVSWIIGYHFNVAVLRAYPTEAAFASYFAQVAGAISLLCLGVQLFAVGRFMQRMGVVGTMVTPPALILVPATLMAFQLNLVLATAARFLDQLFQITLIGAASDSVAAAIPSRHRDTVMTLLRAVVGPLAMAGAGLLLMATERGGVPEWWSRALLPVLVVLWLLAVAGLRRRYLETLMRNLASEDEGVRLTSFSALEGLTSEGVSSLLRQALVSGREDLQVFALQMLREPSLMGLADEVEQALAAPSPAVRREAVETLALVRPERAAATLTRLLDDPAPEVRRSAAETAQLLAEIVPEGFTDAVVARLGAETDPEVWSAHLIALSTCGWDRDDCARRVEDMASSPDPAWRKAAAAALPVPLPADALDAAWRLLEDGDLEVRRSALRALRGPYDPGTAALILARLRQQETAEAAGLALRSAGATGVTLLRAALPGEDASTRARLCGLLSDIGGPEAVDALLTSLEDSASAVREAAALGLAGLRIPGGVGELDAALVAAAERLAGAAARLVVARALPAEGPSLLVRDEAQRDRARAESALITVVRMAAGAEAGEAARRLLDASAAERHRAIALELIDTSLRGSARTAVLRLLEPASEEGRAALAPRWSGMTPAELLQDLTGWDDDWMARSAGWALQPMERKNGMLTLMEKILFLRQVDLFRDLPGRDLAVIAQGTREVAFQRGQLIFEEGAPGDALFLITSGSVAVTKGSGEGRRIVAILGERECFGEMAILTGEPRSASVEAVEDVQALAISRQGFRDLIVSHPHIAFPIFEMLAHRLKETTERYHERLATAGGTASG